MDNNHYIVLNTTLHIHVSNTKLLVLLHISIHLNNSWSHAYLHTYSLMQIYTFIQYVMNASNYFHCTKLDLNNLKVLETGPLRFGKGKLKVTFTRPLQLKGHFYVK